MIVSLSALPLGGCDGLVDADWALIAVSGHCFPGCEAENYLVDERSADAVASALPDADGDVPVQGYIDSYEATDNGEGFVDLVGVLQDLEQTWLDDEHVLAVMCHSHGCVWAHTALQVVDVDVEILVDLDAESAGWEDDDATLNIGDEWAGVIDDDQREWPFDIGDAVNSYSVPGLGELQDVEDVVPEGVLNNLEAASLHYTFIQDAEPNHLIDGSQSVVTRAEFDELHWEVDDVGSEALSWVVDQVAAMSGSR